MIVVGAVLAGGIVLFVGLVLLGLAITRPTQGPPAAAAAAAPVAALPAPAPRPAPAAPALTPDQITLAAALVAARRIETLQGDELVAALEMWESNHVTAEVAYALLMRNAEAHRRQGAVFTGRIEEARDLPNGGTFMRLATRSYSRDVLWVETMTTAPPDLAQGSRVRVYGYLMGTQSYRSQAGWEITIPALAAVAVVPSRTPRHLTPGRRARLQSSAP